MKRILIVVFLIMLLSGCQNVAVPKVVQQDTAVVESAPPIISAKPTHSLPQPSSTPLPYTRIADPNENFKITDAPALSPIPIGVLNSYSRYSEDGELLETKVSPVVYILGGFDDGYFYDWEQYKYGAPPLRGYDFIHKYKLNDYESANYPNPSNALIRPEKEFFLYGANGLKYQGQTKGNAIFSWDEGTSYLCSSYRSKQKELPSGYYIAVFGDWDALPRAPKIIDQNGSMEIDLDGDGTQETIEALRTQTQSLGNCIMYIAKFSNVSYLLSTYSINSTQHGLYQYGEEKQLDTYAFAFPIDVNGDGTMEVATFALTASGSEEMDMFSVTKENALKLCNWGIAS